VHSTFLFIFQHTLSYNSLKSKCFWKTPPIHSGKLKAAEGTHIDALCWRKIKMKCLNKVNTSVGINNTMIATIDRPLTLITGLPSIVKFENEGLPTHSYRTAIPTQSRLREMIHWVLQSTIHKTQNLSVWTKYFFANLMQEVMISSIEQE
jgi:hypothetical protein